MSILDTYDQVNVTGDGNCFYRAVSLGLYGTEDRHTTLRVGTMASLLRKRDSYGILFETAERFARCVHANKRDGVWNTDVSDLAPDAAADLLSIHLIIYNKNIFTGTIDPPVVFNAGASTTVRLMRVANCHYNLLKEKAPAEPAAAAVAETESDSGSEITISCNDGEL